MFKDNKYDAIVVGSGPNGLAAAITLAQAHLRVALVEAKSTIGGGMRSAELTLPGYIHDICSAIHPLGIGSPFFKTLPLSQHGLEWVHPLIPLAHPFINGGLVTLEGSLDLTCSYLKEDGDAYRKLMNPFVASWDHLASDILAPLHLPSHPIEMARFGYYAIKTAQNLAHHLFKQEQAKALFAGLAAHSNMPLDKHLTAAFGIILGVLGHVVGWPMPRGGTQQLANALGSYFTSIGGEIVTNTPIEHIDELPEARAILLDVTPKQIIKMVGDRLPLSYKQRLQNYRYGPGIFKMDWALNSPIPWKNQGCLRAGTVHLGGTLEDIVKSEADVAKGFHPEKGFTILAQPSLFDPGRAPPGKHTAWGYCHVPNGSSVDMTESIENHIEQYAPGFKDCIIGRHTMSTADLEKYNPNYIGGDINGGVEDIYQLFTRPVARMNPYSTPVKGLYICSASTPPGGGVHGMCGYHAAQSVLSDLS
jgi:phytoene dehydrogenase-like protein